MDNTAKHKVVGRIVIEGNLQLCSPAIIGSGDCELADVEVLRDSATDLPFIPATSLMGVLKHSISKEKLNLTPTEKEQYEYLLGKETIDREDSIQSALLCSDLTTDSAKVVIRDGIKINLAEDKKKYDYEVIEPGAKFKLHWEIILREAFEKEIFKKILATMLDAMENCRIRIGAKTNQGFGCCKLINLQYAELDFGKPEHVLAWLRGDYFAAKTILDTTPFPVNEEKIFTIEALFSIKNSLIIKSYPHDLTSPDAVHIKSDSNYVLPGTSIRGAIRQRALRILKTLDIPDAEKIIDKLFGTVVKGTKEKIKGRIQTEETIINTQGGMVVPELQTRIRIDRFTGGVIDGALFDSMPLWQKNKEQAIKICLKIKNYEEGEPGLLLQILKDLWVGDLPVGGEKNVGRGVLEGIKAYIGIGSAPPISLEAGPNHTLKITPDDEEKLAPYTNLLDLLKQKEASDARD